ncbi:MAG: hypothetical protein L3J93_04875 [Thermoplasmata archaeon]|nr:hypothetical protein [Thermoplasmata archaeon]
MGSWPAVQLVFVLETTPYDGVYDPSAHDPGRDACALRGATLCEESNGIPFFVANAQAIADGIAARHPESNVSFALVDYFATGAADNDPDGSSYHVDVGTFVAPSGFGTAVRTTFQSTVLSGGYVYSDSDLSDNVLTSSSITALYGALLGDGLGWSPRAHHVLVWLGSTAPQDPAYAQAYLVGPSDHANASSTCEPAHAFGSGASPRCEGWFASQDGNISDSIAAFAGQSSSCEASLGAACTIDAIDLYSTPTDASSPGWPCSSLTETAGGCPSGATVRQNVAGILNAGCDIAAATGGTWDGPSGYRCVRSTFGPGSLTPTFVGASAAAPRLDNPSLLLALGRVGFGEPPASEVALGANQPIFQFVPFGAVEVLAGQTATPRCTIADGTPFPWCGRELGHALGGTAMIFTWNWSDAPSHNAMTTGDQWSVSFLVEVTGGPYRTVPVDACVSLGCLADGGGSVAGEFAWAAYRTPTSPGIAVTTFPLAEVTVEPSEQGWTATNPLPVLGGPPSSSAPVPPLAGIGSIAQVLPGGFALLSIPAVMAGTLAAGLARTMIRTARIATPVKTPARVAPARSSAFEMDREAESGDYTWHFE